METHKLTIGDTVIYSTAGVCRVNGIVSRGFGYESRDYYELTPIFDVRSTCFVPVDYDEERVHIEPAMTKAQAEALLDYAEKATPLQWITSPNERKQEYGLVNKKGSREEKIRLIKTLMLQEQKQKEIKKQLYASDERILSGCKAHIFNELAYVLGKTTDEVEKNFEHYTCKNKLQGV